MARLAVLASGSGTNFEAIVEALRASRKAQSLDGAEGSAFREARDRGTRGDHDDTQQHTCIRLIYDRKAAFAAERAKRLGVAATHVSYAGRDRLEAEAAIEKELEAVETDLVALAGFMRILTPGFVSRWKGRLVNIHPSLLPAWPGAGAIERAYAAGEKNFGVSVHFVDEGMDTGPLIAQDSIERQSGESLAELEARIHALEHRLYPRVILDLLDGIETARSGA